LPDLFSTRESRQAKSEEALIATLYQEIGHLKVQLDWLEKNKIGPLVRNERLSSQGIRT
jgi:putative transposase